MSVSSDQRMKGQGNHGNNGSTSNIQYPTFSVKVGQWSNSSTSRDKVNNHRFDGNNGDYNAWGGSVNQGGNQYHSRKGHGYDDYNSYNNSNRGGYHGVNDGGVKHVERGMQGLGLGGHYDRNAPNNTHGGGRQEQQQKDAPRKMTWASIASQPAKPTVTQTSTILKKKGPGMPPPPMVPGRHAGMDIGTWDSPSKNGPPLVPPTFNSEPPQSAQPISASFAEEPQPNRQVNGTGSSGKGTGPAWPTPGQAMSAQQPPQPQPPQQQQQVQQQQQQPPPPQENQRRPERQQMPNYNHHDSGSMNQNHAGGFKSGQSHPMQPPSHQHHSNSYMTQPSSFSHSAPPPPVEDTTEALNRLLDMSKYNPPNYEIENADLARFFVIKSYSEDDIHRSIKYNIWCSTEHGNKRLDQAFHEREKEGGAVYLFYSVNGSGHFCGMAQMISPVDYSSNSSVWAQDKWKGSFKVRWVYVKDVPNPQLRHIRLENNENKPVTNSRDTQEVPNTKGQQVWRIIHAYKHSTSLFDDFVHYEQRQQEESTRRVEPGSGGPSTHTYRSGSPQYDNKYPQDRSGDRGGNRDRYGETNNNARDMGSSSSGGQYDRGYQSNDSKYGGYNNRNNYGSSGFDRNNYQSGSGGNSSGYNNRSYGYRRDDQGSRSGNMDGDSGTSPGSYHSRSGGSNYRGNNRGGFNNDYYNNRRQDNRDRGDRGYRPQNNSIDYEKE